MHVRVIDEVICQYTTLQMEHLYAAVAIAFIVLGIRTGIHPVNNLLSSPTVHEAVTSKA